MAGTPRNINRQPVRRQRDPGLTAAIEAAGGKQALADKLGMSLSALIANRARKRACGQPPQCLRSDL
jgi:hypothetical protein